MKNAPNECPKCGSPATQQIGVNLNELSNSRNFHHKKIYQLRQCRECNCGFKWAEVYLLSYDGFTDETGQYDKQGERTGN